MTLQLCLTIVTMMWQQLESTSSIVLHFNQLKAIITLMHDQASVLILVQQVNDIHNGDWICPKVRPEQPIFDNWTCSWWALSKPKIYKLSWRILGASPYWYHGYHRKQCHWHHAHHQMNPNHMQEMKDIIIRRLVRGNVRPHVIHYDEIVRR